MHRDFPIDLSGTQPVPDLAPWLPARWQGYAAWLAGQDAPPKSYRAHPLASADELDALKKDFQQHLGLSLGKYLRLKRLRHLLSPGAQSPQRQPAALAASLLHTPLGPMLAVFSPAGLCLLEFPERKAVESELLAVQKARSGHFVWQHTPASQALQKELDEYFAGQRQHFSTALDPVGTDFQQAVWRELQTIPHGATRSYLQQAKRIGKPQAVRAVAAANGQNKISILIPCHRVIGSDGSLTGYGGGLDRKRALLVLEGALLA